MRLFSVLARHFDYNLDASLCYGLKLRLSTDDNLELVSDLDCVGYLIQALRDHTKHAKVVKNSCMALASLVEPDGK